MVEKRAKKHQEKSDRKKNKEKKERNGMDVPLLF
jgi:hypothetical protein